MGALGPSLLWGLSRARGVLAFHLSLMGIPGCVGAVPLGFGGLGVFFSFPLVLHFFAPPDPCAGDLRSWMWALPLPPDGLPRCFVSVRPPLLLLAGILHGQAAPSNAPSWPLRSAPCRFGRLFNPLASRPFPTVSSSARPVPPAGPGGLAHPRVPSPAYLLVGSGGHCLGRVVLRLRGLSRVRRPWPCVACGSSSLLRCSSRCHRHFVMSLRGGLGTLCEAFPLAARKASAGFDVFFSDSFPFCSTLCRLLVLCWIQWAPVPLSQPLSALFALR